MEDRVNAMGYYPVFLELSGRSCVVIGGGVVAERKVEGLLSCGAIVTVISPALTERLESWAGEGKICRVKRGYEPGDLLGHQIAFVATNDGPVNAAVALEGKEGGVWVNAADDPDHCDLILPSVLKRGDLVIAVGSGGASPALSRLIREELEVYFTDDYTLLAQVVAEVRRELKQRSIHPGAKTWQRALNGDLRRLIREGRPGEAKAHLLKRLGDSVCR